MIIGLLLISSLCCSSCRWPCDTAGGRCGVASGPAGGCDVVVVVVDKLSLSSLQIRN